MKVTELVERAVFCTLLLMRCSSMISTFQTYSLLCFPKLCYVLSLWIESWSVFIQMTAKYQAVSSCETVCNTVKETLNGSDF